MTGHTWFEAYTSVKAHLAAASEHESNNDQEQAREEYGIIVAWYDTEGNPNEIRGMEEMNRLARIGKSR
jgi:hypothetical protein